MYNTSCGFPKKTQTDKFSFLDSLLSLLGNQVQRGLGTDYELGEEA